MSYIERHNVMRRGSDGPTVMFAHGFGCDQTMWNGVLESVGDNCRAVLFDVMGCGKSQVSHYDPEKYAQLDAHAEDINGIADELGLRDAILVGHSVSAITGILAANAAPEHFSRLVLVAPSPSFLNDGDYTGGFDRSDLEGMLAFMEENHLGWSQTMAPTIAGEDEGGPTASRLTQSFCQTDPAVARHFGRVTFLSDRRADVQASRTPALILQCANDAIAPVSVGEWMQKNMQDSRLEILDVSGHCPHMTNPGLTASAMMSYLNDARQ